MDKKEAIEHFGGSVAYERQNDEALVALAFLMRASNGHSMQAVGNGSLILTVAMLRGCGASVEDVRRLVVEAWDNEVVLEMLKALKPREVCGGSDDAP